MGKENFFKLGLKKEVKEEILEILKRSINHRVVVERYLKE